ANALGRASMRFTTKVDRRTRPAIAFTSAADGRAPRAVAFTRCGTLRARRSLVWTRRSGQRASLAVGVPPGVRPLAPRVRMTPPRGAQVWRPSREPATPGVRARARSRATAAGPRQTTRARTGVLARSPIRVAWAQTRR